jgi:hypothetical protein
MMMMMMMVIQVGLLPEEKLYEFLNVALSPDSTRTVNYVRDFMRSGVDPSALVSQLANLITDILAGKKKAEDLRRLDHGKLEIYIYIYIYIPNHLPPSTYRIATGNRSSTSKLHCFSFLPFGMCMAVCSDENGWRAVPSAAEDPLGRREAASVLQRQEHLVDCSIFAVCSNGCFKRRSDKAQSCSNG